jgi:predicted PurR-regulated permease PerM
MGSRFSLSPRQKRLLLWVALGVLIGWMIWAARSVLIPYLIGLVLAYLLLPIVNWFDRHIPDRLHKWGISRAISIILAYLLAIALVTGIFAFVVPIIVQQVNVLIENWPELVSTVRDWGERGLGWYEQLQIEIPFDWRTAIEENLRTLLNDVLDSIQAGVVATVRTVSSTVSFIIGLVVIPFWLFYILHDESQVKAGALRALPQQMRPDVVAIARLIDDVLSAYIRGQLLLVLFVGGLATLALSVIGVPFSLVLGVIAGIFEVIPFVGPILGAIPAVLVALLSDPASAIWVALAFFAIQQIENLILAPRIAGESVQLHPAMVMVVIVVGNELAGFLGLLLAVPIAAIIRDVFKYLYLRLLDEPLPPEKAVSEVRSGEEVQLSV